MRYLVVDIETTGLSRSSDRVIELAAVDITRFVDSAKSPTLRQLKVQHFLFNPGMPIPVEAIKVHGITDELVLKSPLFSKQADAVHELLSDAVVVGHHIEFDIGFLAAEFRRVGKHYSPQSLCTLVEARKLLPHLESHKLEALNRHFGLSRGRAHRASIDAKTTALLYFCLRDLRGTGESTPAGSPTSAVCEPTPAAVVPKKGKRSAALKVKAPAAAAPKRLNTKRHKKTVSDLKNLLKSMQS